MAPLTLTVTDSTTEQDEIDAREDDAIDAAHAEPVDHENDDDSWENDDVDEEITGESSTTPEPAAQSILIPVPAYVESYLSKIRETESRAAMIAAQIDGIKEDLKSAKQRYEDAVNELRGLVRRGPDPQASLPFPDDDDVSVVGTQTDPPTTNTTVNCDDSWRAVPIVELESLPEAIKSKLLDAGISTVGELADYTSEGNLLTDIKGIGQAKAEKVEAALEKFWEGRKE